MNPNHPPNCMLEPGHGGACVLRDGRPKPLKNAEDIVGYQGEAATVVPRNSLVFPVIDRGESVRVRVHARRPNGQPWRAFECDISPTDFRNLRTPEDGLSLVKR